MSARIETIAYQVWAHCEPIGWNCTMKDCAKAIGTTANIVGQAAKRKGWSSRFRVTRTETQVMTGNRTAPHAPGDLAANAIDVGFV